MSIEIMEGMGHTSEEEQKIREQAEIDRQKGYKLVLKLNKPFKELLMGKEDLWEQCREVLIHDIYNRLYAGETPVSKDFLAGIKWCVEMIPFKVKEYDEAFSGMEDK